MLKRSSRKNLRLFLAAWLACGCAAGFPALASEGAAAQATVAVASNFLGPARELQARFEKETGHSLKLVGGSTGKLYAQILHGAPVDLFLAADQKRPESLARQGRVQARITYARGRLALWSAREGYLGPDPVAQLRQGRFRRLAIANPKTAPYGQAARAVLERLDLWKRLAPKRVRGENIGQTFQFVATDNAELGFVALAQVRDPRLRIRGSAWVVPENWHAPLNQDAVLLKRGSGNSAARAFFDYLQSAEARAVLKQYGYGLP